MTQRPPLKWLKYLLLAQSDLTTLDRLDKEVQRFAWANRKTVFPYLKERLAVAQASGDSILVVVKFVDEEAVGALPNVRVRVLADLEALADRISSVQRNYTELWCCETRVSSQQLSVAGRLLLQDPDLEIAQRVEQVWRASPRMIEELAYGDPLHAVPFPYVRASRPSWGWRFTIERLHQPEASEKAGVVEHQFHRTMGMIEDQRHKIERFVSKLHRNGAKAVTLEYKAAGDSLWFIDWDTAIDQQLIARMTNEK